MTNNTTPELNHTFCRIIEKLRKAMRNINIYTLLLLVFMVTVYPQNIQEKTVEKKDSSDKKVKIEKLERINMAEKVQKSEEEWKGCLTPEEYRILREKGTEPAFTGKYYRHKEDGIYVCAACGNELFSSDHKYDSGSGWPSYWQPVSDNAVEFKEDRSYGMVRTEVLCGSCGGHLGHVFEDGPQPTGLRYCINSVSLDFEKVGK